ncbi:MAG: DinB family protein [Flavobacteriales bacterium]|jgi:hypothetical protein|nr:DinB family protein [Flavobacteriales bacterium]
MQYQFRLLNATRTNILSLIKGLTLEQFNFIPNNFNNSIGWQLGHLVVTQQLLNYKLSGLPMNVEDTFIENFRKGSSGKYILTQEQLDSLISLFTILPKQLETDYDADIFTQNFEYQTSYNVTLTTIEDAISFNNIHEAMHLGTIAAMKKCIPVL